LNTGLQPKPALALARAGYRSLADLEGAMREELLGIPGVGPTSLDLIEELLGQPLAREGKKRKASPAAPWPEHLWRKRGLATEAAITFVQMGMTMERLKSMTREELLGLRGVGLATVHACELIIGREIPSRKRADPGEVFWRQQGFGPRAARALSRAGIRSPEDLREWTREGLLALLGFGDAALARLEAALGRKIERRR
jgi:hypothetical protein